MIDRIIFVKQTVQRNVTLQLPLVKYLSTADSNLVRHRQRSSSHSFYILRARYLLVAYSAVTISSEVLYGIDILEIKAAFMFQCQL